MNTIIHRYEGGRDREIADLVLSIQNAEAGLNLSVEDQPDLLNIADAYRDGGFWIAVDGRDTIVGTIGLLVFGRVGVLKKFFVAAGFRGRGGPARGLLGRLLDRARGLGMTDIVLDTPAVAARSHGFYARSGFEAAKADDVPAGYSYPDRDSILYRLRLAS